MLFRSELVINVNYYVDLGMVIFDNDFGYIRNNWELVINVNYYVDLEFLKFTNTKQNT